MDTFVWPFAFFLISLPILTRVFLATHSNESQKNVLALRVPFFDRVSGFGRFKVPNFSFLRGLLLWTAWIFFVLAAMRPIAYQDTMTLPREARNIMLAIDVSGSMGEKDYNINGLPVSRLSMVKTVVNDFIKNRADDNIGMVVFGSEAFTYAPLSYDKKTLRDLFGEVELGIAGEQTAIGDAVALSVQGVQNAPADSRIVILLSDGYSNAGSVSVAQGVELAKKLGVKIYTIGVGARQRMIQSLMGMMMLGGGSDLDEKTLKAIADATGGKYFRAASTDELQEIYQTIDALEQVQSDELAAKPQTELFYIPLMGCLLCLFGAVLLKRRVS